ncbi:hypothetical protein RGQ29_009575 [Quercus rubra]|uniref:TF-B3 domain-containing protein n=1 Tax=Quercus rubra TaxID=3512 RepID=A0AAN7FYQ6_QUERU|nr:hypothetical protein RGQ29_009575 [Quercus rubra]KAK4599587.1 hypothetical protein RGQ29_009575 [Quercus rubra]
MGETCKDWNKWAEEIYWTHFQTIHFSQYLLGDYDRQLAIPKKFVDNVKKKLPQSVTLKGPSGLTWDVELKTIDDTLFFNHGWQEFVKDHSLEETDLLVFRKCGPTEHDNGCLTKKKAREGSIDDVHTPLDDGVACPSPLNYVSDDSVTVPSEQCIISLVSNKRTRQSARSVGSKEPATCGEGVKSAASDDAECSPIFKNSPQGPQYSSNRRLVSEDEIKNALLLAQAASSDDTYLVVMRPTHVYKRFFVYIPLEWATNHLSLENQEIHLRFNKDTWRARYNHNRVRGYGGITGGWKYFVIDNNLEEFDVCLFKPAGQMDGSTILDVSIFRVVEEISPRTLLTPPRKRGRKNSIKIH